MRRSAMRRGVLAVLGLAVGVVPATSVSLSTSAQADDLAVPEEVARDIVEGKVVSTYIVTMADEPAATYDGGTAGIPATAPDAGEKLDTTSKAVTDYRNFLKGRHSAALSGANVGQAKKFYDYSVTINGFAAKLSGSEAARLKRQPGVISVELDKKYQLDTITTPDFLKLTAPGGAWSRDFRGGKQIIGIVDSGIWPENPSFSNAINANLQYGPHPRWNGTCQIGERFAVSDCNNKLIGARFYANGWGGPAVKTDFPYEYYSPRDADGHGSHTASTAGGNEGVPVEIEGTNYGKASGMAPRARIAAYKVCWGRGGEGGCFGSDSVAAIDQAVADGVDVINFSISGTSTDFVDPVELAFLRATNAGVFVAASAGNSGPAESTVAHPSPWITTVAASTHDRLSQATLSTGDNATYIGASAQQTGTPVLDLVYAVDVKAAAATDADAALCKKDTLDSAKVAGKMVLCNRGVIGRTEKSMTVKDAGGEAMVLGNTSPNSINADIHFVPTIHVDAPAREAILTYIKADGPSTGKLAPGVTVKDETAPLTAVFSSRGPLLAGEGDLLKPDITAPGVDVLAAVSPDGYFGRNYDLLSGTSMSSPHMAGLAAVLKSAHRTWTPTLLKSAMMTTAYDVEDASPFDVGSGHVRINKALGPALSYEAGFDDYINFLCGTGDVSDAALCTNPIDASDLNQPNIAIGELAGSQTVTRTVTKIGDRTETFTASVQAPPGVDVVVEPASFTLNKRETQKFTVKFTATDAAAFDEYTFGKLTWTDTRGHKVKSDIAVKPVALAAPDEVSGTGAEGSGEFDITFGYTGPYKAEAHGLNPATQQDGTVADDPANDINTALRTGVGVKFHPVVVPAGTLHTRVSLFDEYTDGNDDLDLYLFRGNTFVGASGSGSSEEQVDVANPEPGTYTAVVHGWQTDEITGGPGANYTLFDWSVPADHTIDPNTLVIDSAPAAAVVGTTGTIQYSWSGLANNKYLGAVSHNRGTDLIDATLVSVDNDTP